MSRRLAALLLLASAGCVGGAVSTAAHESGEAGGAKPEGGAPGDAKADSKPDAQKLDDLAWAVGMAEQKLDRAKKESDHSEHDQASAVQRATDERDDARKAVQHFESFEKPTRLAKAELELKDANDYLTEQDEEMRQLELLYEKDDLGDKTKEIVLARGRRRHQRAQERLEMAKRDFENLRGFELEQQGMKLARELDTKERDLKRALWSAEFAKEDKLLALKEAERALAKARRELKEAQGGNAPGEMTSLRFSTRF